MRLKKLLAKLKMHKESLDDLNTNHLYTIEGSDKIYCADYDKKALGYLIRALEIVKEG